MSNSKERSTLNQIQNDEDEHLMLKRCHMPHRETINMVGPSTTKIRGFQDVAIKLHDLDDKSASKTRESLSINLEHILQVAWAITISAYEGVEHATFCFCDDKHAKSVLQCALLAESSITDIILDLKKSHHLVFEELDGGSSLSPVNSLLLLEQPDSKPSVESFSGINHCMVIHKSAHALSTARLYSRADKQTLERTTDVLQTFGKVLTEILSADKLDSLTISNLDMLSRRDYDRILVHNHKQHDTIMTTFHETFHDVALRTPDAPAICSWGDGDFTYNELDVVTDKLAYQLNSKMGICVVETPILICFDKSSLALICMLAILKAGGAFVCIDPTYQADRIEAIMEKSGGRLVLSQQSYDNLFTNLRIKCKVATIDFSYLNQLSPASSDHKIVVKPSNTAYIHFTSGSTGVPKGIMIEHRQLSTAVSVLAAPMHITSTSRVLQFAAYIFDLSFGDIFVTLAQGGCICNPSEHERVNDLPAAIRRMDVNLACLVPSIARLLRPEDVPSLKTLLLGGEALLQENLQTWGGKVDISAMYGPSECTVWCTSQMDMSQQSQVNNIGRGYGANLWVVKSSNHHQLAPIGCTGELLIEGPLLARGYLDVEQTEKAFVTGLKWAISAERRFYKTGDLVRYNSDGSLCFVGRKDTQIKLHGRRIELGEIEHHLASHPVIKQAMVILPDKGVHAKRLVAVLALQRVVQEATSSDIHPIAISKADMIDIKTFMLSKLASYMQPQVWIALATIPLLISAKLDRPLVKRYVNALTAGNDITSEVTATNDEYNTPEILAMTDIWSQALNMNGAVLNNNQTFLSLGGDSFSAMEIVSLCRSKGIRVRIEDVMQKDITIQKLVEIARHTVTRSSPRRSTMMLRPIWWTTDERNAVTVQ